MTRPCVARAVVLSCLLTLPALAGHAEDPPGAVPAGAPPGIEAGQDAVLLEENQEIEIVSPTLARVRHLERTKILTPRGAEEYGTASIFYNPSSTIRDLRAAVISPEGKRSEVKKQQIFEGAAFAGFELYSDSKHRSIDFPGAVPGATLEYSYEQEFHNLFYLPCVFLLQEEIPARLKTLTVRLPSSMSLRFLVRGSPEYDHQETGDVVVHRWRVRDVPALRLEHDMPPSSDILPLVEIFLKEIVWDQHRIDATTWNGIARWEWDLSREKVVPTDEVAQKARDLSAGLTDPMAITRRLYEFVQKEINYVAIELGIGGYEPHQNGAVFKNRYGDCKDKATLLIAMLKAVGLRGFPVSIRTRDEGVKDRDYPTPASNHAIVAVPAEGGYLFMDPTSETTPFGDLPWVDQGANVLVVKDDGTGDLVETPTTPAEKNRIRWSVTASIGPTGDLEGSYLIDAFGQNRSEFAGFVASTKPTEREDTLAHFMARICPGAVLEGQQVTAAVNPDDPLRITIRFRVPRFLVRAGSAEVVSPHLVRFPFLTRIAAYPARLHPVFFDYLSSETSEVRLYLPPGKSLKRIPTARALEAVGLSASTSYEVLTERGREILVVKRTVSVNRREIPVSDYAALRQLLSSISEEEARAVTLQPAG
ncbi:MAG TPA: DUF3857 domain-containing protein [Candidatus Polarisedimenticolia bacterium]|nr:DUF3857 domain-containing protein [Candidatus Polarisedimenticolia bacterium]